EFRRVLFRSIAPEHEGVATAPGEAEHQHLVRPARRDAPDGDGDGDGSQAIALAEHLGAHETRARAPRRTREHSLRADVGPGENDLRAPFLWRRELRRAGALTPPLA